MLVPPARKAHSIAMAPSQEDGTFTGGWHLTGGGCDAVRSARRPERASPGAARAATCPPNPSGRTAHLRADRVLTILLVDDRLDGCRAAAILTVLAMPVGLAGDPDTRPVEVEVGPSPEFGKPELVLKRRRGEAELLDHDAARRLYRGLCRGDGPPQHGIGAPTPGIGLEPIVLAGEPRRSGAGRRASRERDTSSAASVATRAAPSDACLQSCTSVNSTDVATRSPTRTTAGSCVRATAITPRRRLPCRSRDITYTESGHEPTIGNPMSAAAE